MGLGFPSVGVVVAEEWGAELERREHGGEGHEEEDLDGPERAGGEPALVRFPAVADVGPILRGDGAGGEELVIW